MAKRLYTRKNDSTLIVCHKGAHYLSPEDTKFVAIDKVDVTGDKGASTVTVTTTCGELSETWTLKGAYAEGAPASPSTPPEIENVPQETGEPTSELERQLQEAQSRLAVRKAL